jgi:hypothetical protein
VATYTPNTSGIQTGQPVEASHLLNNFSAIQTSVNAIEAVQIASNAVTTAKINNGAVTADKIASSAVVEAKLGTGAVTTAKLASNAVTTVKVTDANITNAKLADEAKAYISKSSPSAATEVIFTGLNFATFQQYEIFFNLAKSADNNALQMQYSTDGGSSWVTSGYEVGTEAKIIGSTTTGAQNGTSETSIELALFGTSAGNGAVGRVEFGQETDQDQFMGFFTTTCRRAGVTDTLVLRGGFRDFQASAIDAVKLFVTSGTLTGNVLLKGTPR